MNRSDRSAAVAVLAVIAVMLSHFPPRAAFTQDAGGVATASNDVKEIRITAKKYEYDPGVITVKQGEHIRLPITALDHDHGFKIEAFHIDEVLKKGEPTSIELTADTIVERASQESPGEQPDASAQSSNR